MTIEQLQYLDKLKKALKKIAEDPSPIYDGYKAYLYKQIAKEALENENED